MNVPHRNRPSTGAAQLTFGSALAFGVGSSLAIFFVASSASWIMPDPMPLLRAGPSLPDSFMSVVGEHGHLQVDRKDEAVEMSHEGGFTWPRSLLNFQIFDRWGGAFPSCIASFFDAIEDDREPYVNATDGWRVTAVLDALHRAAESGGVVTLDGQ